MNRFSFQSMWFFLWSYLFTSNRRTKPSSDRFILKIPIKEKYRLLNWFLSFTFDWIITVFFKHLKLLFDCFLVIDITLAHNFIEQIAAENFNTVVSKFWLKTFFTKMCITVISITNQNVGKVFKTRTVIFFKNNCSHLQIKRQLYFCYYTYSNRKSHPNHISMFFCARSLPSSYSV